MSMLLIPFMIYILLQTVDQFFTLKVPMRSSELNSLFRGIDNAFQVYANHVIDKLGMCNLHIIGITLSAAFTLVLSFSPLVFSPQTLFQIDFVPSNYESSSIITILCEVLSVLVQDLCSFQWWGHICYILDRTCIKYTHSPACLSGFNLIEISLC